MLTSSLPHFCWNQIPQASELSGKSEVDQGGPVLLLQKVGIVAYKGYIFYCAAIVLPIVIIY